MTIPSVEEMKEHNKQAQAAQDLAMMVEQVMLRSPEFSEEVAIARAKVILAAKAHILAQPAGLGGAAQVAPTQAIANGPKSAIWAAVAAIARAKEVKCK
ncbi:MAG: hypothetical protein ACRDCY_18010 [Aeromonas veronii]